MPNNMVSAHGGRWSNQQQNLVVPAGSAVVYYVPDGGMLSNNAGYAILGNLENGQEPGGQVNQQVNAGQSTYDYSCWYAPEFATDCGIYQVGSAQRVVSLQNYDENNPLLLSTIFGMFPNRTIYWVACREITQAQALQHSPDSFLTAPREHHDEHAHHGNG